MPSSTSRASPGPLLPQPPSGTWHHKPSGLSLGQRQREKGAFLGLEEAGPPLSESRAGLGLHASQEPRFAQVPFPPLTPYQEPPPLVLVEPIF